MAWTAVTLIPGVTVSGVWAAFGVSPIYPPSGTAMVPGDWSVDGSGIITLIRSVFIGSASFQLHDGGGAIAGSPEFPAINARLTANISGTPNPGNGLDVGTRLTAELQHYQTTSSVTYTEGIYDGTNLDIIAHCDGALGNDPTGVTLLLEFDITITPPIPDAFWTDRLRCTEFDT